MATKLLLVSSPSWRLFKRQPETLLNQSSTLLLTLSFSPCPAPVHPPNNGISIETHMHLSISSTNIYTAFVVALSSGPISFWLLVTVFMIVKRKSAFLPKASSLLVVPLSHHKRLLWLSPMHQKPLLSLPIASIHIMIIKIIKFPMTLASSFLMANQHCHTLIWLVPHQRLALCSLRWVGVCKKILIRKRKGSLLLD